MHKYAVLKQLLYDGSRFSPNERNTNLSPEHKDQAKISQGLVFELVEIVMILILTFNSSVNTGQLKNNDQ